MNELEQKRIFANNLKHYININGMQQNEFAKAIGENATTVNNWCKGISMPGLGKIQKVADYFGIGKSDLTDDRMVDADARTDAKFLNDIETMDMIRKYYSLSLADRELIKTLIERLAEKTAK